MANMKITRDDAFILWLMHKNPTRPWDIIKKFGSAENYFRSNVGGGDKASLENAVRLVQASDADLRFVSYTNPEYPKRLQEANNPPLGLFVYGQLPSETMPAVAIIGARDCTHYGGKVAYDFAKELAEMGITIVSGMARGLDARAHEGALAANGVTLAVLPSGADVCYPSENFMLYKQIREGGCIVSENFPAAKPRAWSYPARNRIISALADVLLVVEAGERSGTSTTVVAALEQGRDVFAVPGKISDPMSAGTNELIKQGANIATSPLDILLALKLDSRFDSFFADAKPPLTGETARVEKVPLAHDQALVYACINHEPLSIDYIAYKTGLKAAELNTILLNMELEGLARKAPGNKYVKA